ncbi:hypothetical protein P0Y43_02255 [Pseudomonas entomophila]|uniref:hypothetical protein n=1 Tax=Pseudomonas entomophila TaxID=312306 RepID=UPI0023D8C5CB|nr:hypothetical protein [Pseudomonas entomophila]MDF0729548.1 hypothetical protein [Pseudomonas entomophila]
MPTPIRLFIILLLALALPLSGMAGVEATTEPCPMQALGMAMMSGMDHDCCQDQTQAPDQHQKSCKPGQACKTSSTLQVTLATPDLTFTHPRPTTPYADSLIPPTPSDRWRPPRA